MDDACEGQFDQIGLRHPNQLGGRHISFENAPQPVPADGAIAHRGQIVEIKIASPRSFQVCLGPLKLLVLHLQFDLMYEQLLQSLLTGHGSASLKRFRREGRLFQSPFRNNRFRPLAQRSGLRRADGFQVDAHLLRCLLIVRMANNLS